MKTKNPVEKSYAKTWSAVEAEASVLVLTAAAADAERAVQVLDQANVRTKVSRDQADLCRQLNESTGAMLIAEEAQVPSELNVLLHVIQQQAKWSDIPVIILTSDGVSDQV